MALTRRQQCAPTHCRFVQPCPLPKRTTHTRTCGCIAAKLLIACTLRVWPVAQGKDAASANKVAFLSDLHRVLEECLDQPFECSAKQIVRGKDPEGANRLLQNLARAGHVLQLDGAAAVQVRTSLVTCE